MFNLRSMTNSIPKFLHITSVEMEAHLGAIAVIGFSRVFRGRYEGKQVALKMYKSYQDVSALSSFLFQQY